MNDLIKFLEELATTLPGSEESTNLINSQPGYLRDAINSNQGRVIKKSISNKELYSDMTTITVY